MQNNFKYRLESAGNLVFDVSFPNARRIRHQGDHAGEHDSCIYRAWRSLPTWESDALS